MGEILSDIVFYFSWRDLLICVLVLTPLEYILPLHARKDFRRRGWLTDAAHYFLSGIFIRAGLLFVIAVAATAGAATVPSSWQAWIGGLPLWLQVALATLIADLGFYFAHRAMHEIPLLWRFHAVHHSSEMLDWLAAYRVHPVDQVIVKGASLFPLYVLGFSADAMIAAALIYQWQALWVHSNIQVPLGPLRHLIVGPEFHHWHHANEHEAHDKNFSGQLPFWDLVFGTLYMPGRMPRSYGVDPPIPQSWLGQMIYPFRRKSRDAGGGSPNGLDSGHPGGNTSGPKRGLATVGEGPHSPSGAREEGVPEGNRKI